VGVSGGYCCDLVTFVIRVDAKECGTDPTTSKSIWQHDWSCRCRFRRLGMENRFDTTSTIPPVEQDQRGGYFSPGRSLKSNAEIQELRLDYCVIEYLQDNTQRGLQSSERIPSLQLSRTTCSCLLVGHTIVKIPDTYDFCGMFFSVDSTFLP
jgi:hypothetical protein